MIGKSLSPVLVEMENALWEHEAMVGRRPEFTDEGFRAAIKIMMAVLMDKMWSLQELEGMAIEDRAGMAQKAGEDFRRIVKTYTDIDTHSLYSK